MEKISRQTHRKCVPSHDLGVCIFVPPYQYNYSLCAANDPNTHTPAFLTVECALQRILTMHMCLYSYPVSPRIDPAVLCARHFPDDAYIYISIVCEPPARRGRHHKPAPLGTIDTMIAPLVSKFLLYQDAMVPRASYWHRGRRRN